MLLYIILAIVMFGLLIAVHEFGHFFTAKLLGVRVNEFSIGMGPKLFSRQKGETLYSLRALPIGGFCAMEGEDGDSKDPRSFSAKSWWRKLIILAAGSFMNFLAGLLIVLLLFIQTAAFRAPVITGFLDGFPLQGEEGLMVGDEILRIDGHRVLLYSDVPLYLSRTNGTMDLTIRRNGAVMTLRSFPLAPQEYEYNGQKALMFGLNFERLDEATPGLRLRNALYQSVNSVRMVWMSLGDLFTGAVGLRDMSGPIGIVTVIGQVGAQSRTAGEAAYNVLSLLSFIAINLAVMNLLPIPALDGGRIFFLAVNGIYTLLTRRRLNPKYEGYINAVCMLGLFALMAVVAVNDVVRLVA